MFGRFKERRFCFQLETSVADDDGGREGVRPSHRQNVRVRKDGKAGVVVPKKLFFRRNEHEIS